MNTIVKFLKGSQVESGTSKNGTTWYSRYILTESLGSHPTKIAFKVTGYERVGETAELKEGDVIRVFFNPVSRVVEIDDYERYFTDLLVDSFSLFTENK